MNTGSVGDTLGIVGDENNQMWEFLLALPDMDKGFLEGPQRRVS